MTREATTIKSGDVGSLEETLGPNDPLVQAGAELAAEHNAAAMTAGERMKDDGSPADDDAAEEDDAVGLAECEEEIAKQDADVKAAPLVGSDGEQKVEPKFTLRGNDVLAAAVVEAWIISAVRSGVNQKKVEDAQRHLQEFREWEPKRLPD